MKLLIIMIQALVLAAIAPLVSGIIRKVKNNIRMRQGQSVFQPYYNLAKLFAKDEVISENTSWIFRIAPFVVLASVVFALSLVPLVSIGSNANYAGDLLLIMFTLALGRFFLSLAALDAGSAFGGMGSSREMFISSLVEPAMLLAIFAVAANFASTNAYFIVGSGRVSFSSVVAGISLVMVIIAETSRIPVDNQETHLELTMIHEAMVLEYSGRSLALLELASHIKQIIFFTILANIVFPIGGLAAYGVKILMISAMIAVIEISLAKMRLFRAVDFLTFSLVLSIAALVISTVGL